MKNLAGKPNNFKNPILGNITHGNLAANFLGLNSILISDKLPLFPFLYKAIITKCVDETIVNKIKTPIIFKIENIDEFKEGDVVLLEPDGRISILYEKDSEHNCLLITNNCNCMCVMCPQVNTIKDDDRTSLNLKLISLMDKKTKYLGLTGGEPSIVKDGLIKIVSECKRKLPKTPLALLTNGILFEDFDYVKELVSINHPDITIQIPLYSDTDSKHDEIIGSKGFYKTIKGIYNFALFRQKVEIRIVIHALNYKRLPSLSEFIYQNFPFVVHVALMGLELEGLASKNIGKLWIDPIDYVDELKKAVKILHRRFINVSIYNHQLCLLPKELWNFSKKSISSWKNIYLETCNDCLVKNMCGGFFSSSKIKHSKYLHPVMNI